MCVWVCMKLITFNLKGMGGGVKKRAVARLAQVKRPDIVFLQEKKFKNYEARLIERTFGHRHMEFNGEPAVGMSGGLLC